MPEVAGIAEDYRIFDIPPNELPMDGNSPLLNTLSIDLQSTTTTAWKTDSLRSGRTNSV